jgi:hypothetical protein
MAVKYICICETKVIKHNLIKNGSTRLGQYSTLLRYLTLKSRVKLPQQFAMVIYLNIFITLATGPNPINFFVVNYVYIEVKYNENNL